MLASGDGSEDCIWTVEITGGGGGGRTRQGRRGVSRNRRSVRGKNEEQREKREGMRRTEEAGRG